MKQTFFKPNDRDVEQHQSYQQADAISNVSSQSYSSSLQNSHSDINSFDNLSEHNYDEISSQPGIGNTHMGTLALYDRNTFTSRRRLERFVERRRTNSESKNQVTVYNETEGKYNDSRLYTSLLTLK